MIINPMDIHNFLKGLVLGFSIAAPVGPIGILTIRRTLSSGRLTGLVSGMGAATADAIYGCIAAFGLTFISNFLIHQQMWLRLVGGAFLCYLGIKTYFSTPPEISDQPNEKSVFSAYGSTFILTITNPLTILSFAAIFTGLGLVKEGSNYVGAALTVLGIFMGSACWWFILSGGVSLLKNRISLTGLRWVNRISGVVILGFGLVSIFGVIFYLDRFRYQDIISFIPG